MKPALQSLGCGVGITSASKRLHGVLQRVYGASLWRSLQTLYWRRRIRQEMASFFRTAEAMGLDPMKNQHPPFQARKLATVHEIMSRLRGINFPLKAATEQQQP